MRSLVVAPLALTACLIAPPPPSERGDDDDDDGCLTPADTAGPAAAIDLAGSGFETLFRVGVQADGAPVVWRFSPPIADTRCPDATTPLIASGFDSAVTSVDSISIAEGTQTFGATPEVFVGVSRGADAEVHIFALAGGELTGEALVTAPGFAPIAVPTSDDSTGPAGLDRPAFVEFIDRPQLLLVGGGAKIGATHYTGGSVGALPILFSGSDNAGADAHWYDVGELGGNADPIALVGGARTYIAAFAGDGSAQAAVQTDASVMHSSCAPLNECVGRVAHRASRPSSYAVLSAQRSDGTVEAITTTGVAIRTVLQGIGRPGAPYAVSDIGFDDFLGGSDLDVAMLWVHPDTVGFPPEVWLYPDIGRGDTQQGAGATYDVLAAMENVTRLVTVRRGAAMPTIVMLSDHPGNGDEGCVFYNGTDKLAACPSAQ